MDIENVLPGLDTEARNKMTAKAQELLAIRKTQVRDKKEKEKNEERC